MSADRRPRRGPLQQRLVSSLGCKLAICLLSLLGGCAAAARNTRSTVDQARLSHAAELAAEQRAPLAYERYQAALRAAQASKPNSAAYGDRHAEARLWLEVAIAEAERQLSSEQRLASERALAELNGELAELERARAELARANELRAAQAIARTEAARALARAAQRPSQRVKLEPGEVRRAAESLIARAELLALTLASFEVERDAALERLDEQLREAKALLDKQPDASLLRADKALFLALSLLSRLRDADSPPSADEKAALAEQLELAGAEVVRADLGLAALLEQAFAAATLAPSAERVVERLCALAQAHASGRVHVSAQGQNARQAEARAGAVRARFARAGCSGERFAFRAADAAGDALETSFVAY